MDCSGGTLGPALLLAGSVTFALIALVLYIFLVLRHPYALTRWVSTATILFNHAQTLATLSGLKLRWPLLVRQLLAALSLNAFRVPQMACLLGDAENSFWISALAMLSLVLFMLLLCIFLSATQRLRLRASAADQLEFATSLVYAIVLTISWKEIASVLASVRKVLGNEYLPHGLAYIALALAVSLLTLLTLLGLHFARNVLAYRRGIRKGEWKISPTFPFTVTWRKPAGCRWLRVLSVSLAPDEVVLPSELEQRVAYLTRRFAPHAPLWQFVICTSYGLDPSSLGLAPRLACLPACLPACVSTHSADPNVD